MKIINAKVYTEAGIFEEKDVYTEAGMIRCWMQRDVI